MRTAAKTVLVGVIIWGAGPLAIAQPQNEGTAAGTVAMFGFGEQAAGVVRGGFGDHDYDEAVRTKAKLSPLWWSGSHKALLGQLSTALMTSSRPEVFREPTYLMAIFLGDREQALLAKGPKFGLPGEQFDLGAVAAQVDGDLYRAGQDKGWLTGALNRHFPKLPSAKAPMSQRSVGRASPHQQRTPGIEALKALRENGGGVGPALPRLQSGVPPMLPSGSFVAPNMPSSRPLPGAPKLRDAGDRSVHLNQEEGR